MFHCKECAELRNISIDTRHVKDLSDEQQHLLNVRSNFSDYERRLLDKFGYGFWSQDSISTAARNWNSAICRLTKTLLKRAVAGKDDAIDFSRFNDVVEPEEKTFEIFCVKDPAAAYARHDSCFDAIGHSYVSWTYANSLYKRYERDLKEEYLHEVKASNIIEAIKKIQKQFPSCLVLKASCVDSIKEEKDSSENE